jgi:hypothetical protein
MPSGWAWRIAANMRPAAASSSATLSSFTFD